MRSASADARSPALATHAPMTAIVSAARAMRSASADARSSALATHALTTGSAFLATGVCVLASSLAANV
jgi:hypothetical protein